MATIPKALQRSAPTKTVRIQMDHIAHANRALSRTCAMAAALHDIGATRTLVHRGLVAFTLAGQRYKYLVPPKLAQFILDFDRGHRVQPCTVLLSAGTVVPAGRYVPPAPPRRRVMKKPRTSPIARPRMTEYRVDGFTVKK